MSEIAIYSLVWVVGAFISSIAQIMLKKSAKKEYPSKIREYLNPLVIMAYMLFFGGTLLGILSLKVVPLSMSPILDASGYIFVAVMSYIFLKEKLTKKQFLGMMLIVLGIVVYSITF